MTLTIWGFDSWQQQEYSPQASNLLFRVYWEFLLQVQTTEAWNWLLTSI